MKEEDYYAAFYQYSKHILYFVARDKLEGYLIAALNYGKHYKKPQTNRNYISNSPLTGICHTFCFGTVCNFDAFTEIEQQMVVP